MSLLLLFAGTPVTVAFVYEESPQPRHLIWQAKTTSQTEPTVVTYQFVCLDEPQQPKSRQPIWRRQYNDPDPVAPLASVLAPYAVEDQDNPRNRRLLLSGRQGDPDLTQPQPQWITFAYDEAPGPRRLLRRANPPDPDLVTIFIHPPWAPYVFDDQDSPRQQRPFPIKARQGDPDLTQPSPQWQDWAYDEPPGPRRLIGRSKTNDPDVAIATSPYVFLDELTQLARRSVGKARPSQDPDLVTIFIHPPWLAYVVDDQDNPRRQRVPPKARQGDPDADVATVATRVILEDAQFPGRSVRKIRQGDPDPDTFPTVITAPIVTEDQPSGPRREIVRARTIDPDLVGALARPWLPYLFDDQDNPKPHPRLYRARQIDPDIVAAITAPTITFIFDEPPGPRRSIIRARSVDPDVVVPVHAFLVVVEDLQFRASPSLVRARVFDLVEPTLPSTPPLIFTEDLVPFARRLAWHRPPTDPDIAIATTRLVVVTDEPTGARRLFGRAKINDPDVIVAVPSVPAQPSSFLEDILQFSRRLIGRGKTTNPDLIGIPPPSVVIDITPGANPPTHPPTMHAKRSLSHLTSGGVRNYGTAPTAPPFLGEK